MRTDSGEEQAIATRERAGLFEEFDVAARRSACAIAYKPSTKAPLRPLGEREGPGRASAGEGEVGSPVHQLFGPPHLPSPPGRRGERVAADLSG